MAEKRIYVTGGNLTAAGAPMAKFSGEQSVFIEGGTVFIDGGGSSIQGEWDPDTPYTTGQVVSHNNSLYIATTDTTGDEPPRNGAGIWVPGEDLIPTTLLDGDVSDIKIGILFSVDEDCELVSYHFYKGDASNGGTHVGELWSIDTSGAGTMEEQVTFSGETASGWQSQASATNPALTAGQSYILAVRFPQGRYSFVLGAAPTLHSGPVRTRICYFTNNSAVMPDTVVTNGGWQMIAPGVQTAGSAQWLQLAKGDNAE